MVLCVHGRHHTKKALAKLKKIVDEQTAHILEPPNYFMDISGREFVQFFVMTKDYHRDINRAQHGKLMSLLEKATFTFEKSTAMGESAGVIRTIKLYSIISIFFFGGGGDRLVV